MFNIGKIKKTEIIKDVDIENSEYMNLFRFGVRVKDENIRERVLKDAILHKIGLEGEMRVMHELKYSFIPMHIFHNVRLEEDGLSAQIDVMVITNRVIYFIETKNLYGDIEVNSNDEFIRHFKNSYGKYYGKEAMYNPNSQLKKHRNVFSELTKKHNAHSMLVPKISLIVLANNKSIINTKKASEMYQWRVFKLDKLISKMKEAESGLPYVLTNTMLEYSKFIQENCKPPEYDYMRRYGLQEDDLYPEKEISQTEIERIVKLYQQKTDLVPVLDTYFQESDAVNKDIENKNGFSKNSSTDKADEIRKKLKNYRKEQAEKYNISLGFVFSNNEMEYLISTMPKSIEEVKNTPGFGQKKKERHAEDIYRIIQNYL